jgi:hypothetical protein
MTCWALRNRTLLLRRLLLGFSVSNLRPMSHQLLLSSKGMLDLPLSLRACTDCLHTDLNQPKHNLQTACTFWHPPPLDQYFHDFYALLVDGRSQPAASSAKITRLVHVETIRKTALLPTACSPRLFWTFRKCLSNMFQNWSRHTILSRLPFSRYAKIPNAQRTLVRTETLYATASFQGGNGSTDYCIYIQQQKLFAGSNAVTL